MDPLAKQIDFVALGRLQLDPANPRLTEAQQAESPDQQELLRLIDREYDPLTIAESIAKHGYFPSEPMIVLVNDGDTFTVLEGNRRLTALKGLADADLTASFKEPRRWDELRADFQVPDAVPVIRAQSRIAVAALIGYRHISGIEPWKPLQKAHFIAELIDKGEELSFDQVNEQVGEPRGTIAALYRNRAMLAQARAWGLDTSSAEAAFGVFTAALNRKAIREFACAPPAPQVEERTPPLPESQEAQDAMSELLDWIFGERRVIRDSRRLRDLALVLDSTRALDILRETRDLAAAYAAAGGPLQQNVKRLRGAADAIRSSVREIGDDRVLAGDAEIAGAAKDCIDAANALMGSLADVEQQ